MNMTLTHNYDNDSDQIRFMLACAHFCLLIGVGSFFFESSVTTMYLSAVFIGFGFGLNWACFPVVCATSYPGDPKADYMKG
eukprot:Pgem_evm1s6116